MDQAQSLGGVSPKPAERAVERWFHFMVWPGFGWAGLAAALTMPWPLASIVIYLTLYAAFAYAMPGSFAGFWRELRKLAPEKSAEIAAKALDVFLSLRRHALPVWARVVAAIAEAWLETRTRVETANRNAATRATMAKGQEPQRMARMGLASVEPEIEEEPRAPVRVARRTRVNWGKFLGALLNWKFWAFLAVALVLLSLASCFDRLPFLDPPSGREVAAEARRDQAEARERTSAAESDQRGASVVRVDARATELADIEQATENARASLQSAADLDARIGVHASFAQRMRDQAAASRAAAVSDYRSSLGP